MIKELRPYQKETLEKLNIEFQCGKTEVVIAAAPSSGKTLMMLKFIQDNPTSKFVILTHGTTVLKEQWEKEFKKWIPEIKTSTKIDSKATIRYGLPQSLSRRNLEKAEIDYLIIDEAHEFTKATMVKKIIKNGKPKRIIYLTGTPSKFIKDGLTPIIIPASRLIEGGFVSDLYVGMVTTEAKLQERDYNSKGDTTIKGDQKLESAVDKDLDSLLEAMHKRLTETAPFPKATPTARKILPQWAPTLGKLHKTMIACNSIAQCKRVEDYFGRQNIKVISSDSQNDPESKNIETFINDKDIKILIVVNRGILGFNLPELVNVVDLTCSRNIDRIYQLYARVMRKHNDYPQKYFFKFSPEDHMIIMKFYMEAALSLLFEQFISVYNGRNLNGFEIPYHVKKQKKSNTNTILNTNKKKRPLKPIPIDDLFQSSVSALKLLTDIYNKIGREHNEYAFTTFAKIKANLKGEDYISVEEKKQLLLKMAKNGEVRPHRDSKLRKALVRYTAKSQWGYDAKFEKEIRKYWIPPKSVLWTEEEAIKILNASSIQKHSDLRKEYPGMFEAAMRYSWQKFKELEKIKYPLKQNNNPKKSLKQLDAWIKENHRLPRQHTQDTVEQHMASLFRNRLNKNSKFIERYPNFQYGKQTRYKRVICIETNQIFEKVTDAIKSFGDYSTANLSRAAKNGTKYRGYHWKYLNE